MQNPGKKFENSVKASIPDEWFYLRLKDSAGFGQSTNENVRFTSSNLCDSILYADGKLIPLELKSTQGTAFSVSRDPKKSAMVKYHQIDDMNKASVYQGVYPGFLFNFRKYDKTLFLSVIDLKKFMDISEKQSINLKDIEDFGGILVDSRKLKVNFRYDIKKMVSEIIERTGLNNGESNI